MMMGMQGLVATVVSTSPHVAQLKKTTVVALNTMTLRHFFHRNINKTVTSLTTIKYHTFTLIATYEVELVFRIVNTQL